MWLVGNNMIGVCPKKFDDAILPANWLIWRQKALLFLNASLILSFSKECRFGESLPGGVNWNGNLHNFLEYSAF